MNQKLTRDQIVAWFEEATAALRVRKKADEGLTWMAGGPSSEWAGWLVDVQSLLRTACGRRSTYYRSYSASGPATYEYIHSRVSIFEAARTAFLQGRIDDPDERIRAGIFGEFLETAEVALLSSKQHLAAATACVGLEAALKDYARLNQIDPSGMKMSDVIGRLAAAGALDKTEARGLHQLGPVRNAALHGEGERVSSEQATVAVERFKAFVEHRIGMS